MGPKKGKKSKKQLEEEKSNSFSLNLFRTSRGREKNLGGVG
jgi:hypothetical protein